MCYLDNSVVVGNFGFQLFGLNQMFVGSVWLLDDSPAVLDPVFYSLMVDHGLDVVGPIEYVQYSG